MASRSMAAMEVPLVGSDSIRWTEVTVPSSLPPSSSEPCGPLTEDSASCHILRDNTYVIRRIHKNQPKTLELLELAPCKEIPKTGLRLIFQDSLCPFAFICDNEAVTRGENAYCLYILTISGVAYLLKLRNFASYVSGSIFLQNELEEIDVQAYQQLGHITSVAATYGCLLVGRHDGSISCFQLGIVSQSSPGFVHDLQDDAGMGRLWGLVTRGKVVSPVQDLVVSEIQGRKLLFVIHRDGCLRVWDLLSRVRLFSQNTSLPEFPGCTFSKLWVGTKKHAVKLIPLAILCRNTLEANKELVIVYNLHFSEGDKIALSLERPIHNIHLDKGRLIDLIITHDKLWILKEDGSLLYDLFQTDANKVYVSGYGLQETFVADQLFQAPEHASDDLLWASSSVFSSIKDQIVPFISSIFLRRLLHPGVCQRAALRATLQDHSKHLTDSEFQSLSITALKREIFSVIENEGITENPVSVFYYWKNICSQYFHYWCQNNIPYSLFLDHSTEAVGLIRKNSISLFRNLEDIELLIYGYFDESGNFADLGFPLPDFSHDCEILLELLRCISGINHHLGRSAAIIYYEALANPQMISSQDIIPCLLKILDVGYSASVLASHRAQSGVDVAREKERLDNKNQRKFSVEMLISLLSLRDKATSWGRVLDILEKFLKHLVPCESVQKSDLGTFFSMNSLLLVQATCQVARVMLESAFDIFLLLVYLINSSGQLLIDHKDISRVQLQLIPMTQKILIQWLIVHLLATTPSESPILEDFSFQLSALHIDNSSDKRSWNKMLGRYDFMLACILLLKFPALDEDKECLSSKSFPNPDNFVSLVRNFSSWIVWGRKGEESQASFYHHLDLATVLLGYHQYEAVENLLVLTEAHSRKEKVSQSVQSVDGEWSACLHLLGFCLLLQAQGRLPGVAREQKIREAVRCFFRAASGEGAHQALHSLAFQTGLPYPALSSVAAWKLHYYQWGMQLFEQYNMSEAACQFAIAALEQVDEVIGDSLLEPATDVRGRLWANIFKFTLDLNNYKDAYCAIISNPDEESKNICLRRFLIVLCERGALKVLCDGELPFVGLVDKVEKELVWKAERSEITANPNPYKLLYAFEMHRNNWRKAATYMYQYSVRLRKEATLKERQLSLVLQERINGLSAAINALHLVHPAYTWIDENSTCPDQHSPNKKARTAEMTSGDNPELRKVQSCIDIQQLENEYVLTSAHYLLVLSNVKPAFAGHQPNPSDILDLLIQANLYDMAFTILLRFWKGSAFKRELEHVFVALSHKCCPSKVGFSTTRANGLLLTYGEETSGVAAREIGPAAYHCQGSGQWEMLELYLEKYRKLHPRLPATVAETLLHMDPQIELPLWLIHMFKGGRWAVSRGMTGQEPDAATLFRLYVNYGRYTEATNLLLEYLDSFASLRPADVINRKKMSAVCFPYTAIERLWCELEDYRNAGHMGDQYEKLKTLLHGALLKHLKQMKMDSQDAVASARS
ncbi:nuclear pore complex protein NUP160 isoform X2 [Aristolochia californica]|uniref:nuclear pore complex protein NUP160 isoform X2 n=1 Tax=Aristolochia californica TaxID=171875 RepID=UPI0035DE2449